MSIALALEARLRVGDVGARALDLGARGGDVGAHLRQLRLRVGRLELGDQLVLLDHVAFVDVAGAPAARWSWARRSPCLRA